MPLKRMTGQPATALLVGSLLLTAVAAWLVVASFRNLSRTAEAVVASQGLLVRSGQLEAILADLVAAQGAYVITANEVFLSRYRAALDAVAIATARLRERPESPQSAALLDALPRRIAALVAEVEQVIALRRTPGAEAAAVERVSQGRGHAAMDSVQALLAAFRQLEDSAFVERRAVMQRARRGSALAGAGTGLLGALTVVLSLARARRRVRDRLEAEARARESEQRATETMLRHSEARYRKAVELNPDGIFIHQDGRIAYANPAGLRMLGAASPDQVIGRSLLDFIDPAHHPVVLQRMQRVEEIGESIPFAEERLLQVDGTPVDLEIGAVPLPYGDRRAIQVVMRNCLSRGRLEEQHRQA